jgi:hypothetical protein
MDQREEISLLTVAAEAAAARATFFTICVPLPSISAERRDSSPIWTPNPPGPLENLATMTGGGRTRRRWRRGRVDGSRASSRARHRLGIERDPR